MPSEHQTGARSKSYDSEAKKILDSKNSLTIAAIIRGIRDPDRVDRFIQAEVDLADADDRDVRQDVIGALNRRKKAIEDGGD